MKTQTINYNTYNFDELNTEAREKAINNNRDINVEHYDWYQFTLDDWTEKLHKVGFTEAKIYFSGFFSQGDGACFDADIDIDKFLEQPKHKKLRRISEEISVSVAVICRRYSHESTRSTRIFCYSLGDRHKRIAKLLTELEQDIENYRRNLCKEIYQQLENEYDHFTGDEAVKESLISNEYEFLKDGSLFIGHRIGFGDLQFA